MLIENHLLILFIFICFVFLNQKQVFSKSELHTKTYVFKTCIGESSICDDNFNEKIIISKNINGDISNTVNFIHPHVIKVKNLDTHKYRHTYISKHAIINNLGKTFILFIEGNIKPFVASKIKIKQNGRTLAVYKLKNIKVNNLPISH